MTDNELRSERDIEDAIKAVTIKLIRDPVEPLTIHCTTIIAALRELLDRRKRDK